MTNLGNILLDATKSLSELVDKQTRQFLFHREDIIDKYGVPCIVFLLRTTWETQHLKSTLLMDETLVGNGG